MDPNGLDISIFGGSKQAAEPVDEGIAADKAQLFMVLGLPPQMLAGAEADLEPDVLDRDREQLPQISGSGLLEVEAEKRQELAQQALFPRAQGLALAPAIGPERPGLGHGYPLSRLPILLRHARPCAGHPRVFYGEDVDDRAFARRSDGWWDRP